MARGPQLGLPAALRARGLKVEVVPGWETRGNGTTFNPAGAIAHWTAGPRGSTGRPSLNICTYGRPGLPGPLCNVYGARDGVAVVVAANPANHGGVGSWRGISGNSRFFGTEMEGADASDFTAAQRWAYPRINAAFCDLGGFGADMVCGHSEYATPAGRKVDINGYTTGALRAEVAAILAGEDDMPLTDADIRRIWEHRIQTPHRVAPAEVILADVDGFTNAAIPAIVKGLLDAPIDRTDVGRGPTSLRSVLAWSDNHVDALASGVAAAVSAAQAGSIAGPIDVADMQAKVQQAVRDAVNNLDVQITA